MVETNTCFMHRCFNTTCKDHTQTNECTNPNYGRKAKPDSCSCPRCFCNNGLELLLNVKDSIMEDKKQ